MRQIGKVVALAAFLGLFLGISFFGPSKDMPFSQVVITYAFQYYQFGYTDIVYYYNKNAAIFIISFFVWNIYIQTFLYGRSICVFKM